MSEPKAPPRVRRFSDLTFVPRAQKGDMAQLAEVSGPSDKTELGTGYVRLTDARIDWTVQYDEVLFVLDGSLRVRTQDGVLEAGPHDSVWLPAGTALTYEAENALVAYAIHPANWAIRQS
ncbi:ethanolamine utilization protein EutQ [Microvirga vignae]|uniref:Ethanolamine utilization protein EutQ n=1 Tax=Microvirga vignae TaxID=1225564 RepID=A0A0H1RBV5_9HYPH|nr:ethanolamine utilization protein EutQ [Microvirga vignae]KLK90087.1 ethanolamine utilization protein EutQ [Microvirga vignae]